MPSSRGKALVLVEKLINSQLPKLRVYVTSRPEVDIKVVLEPLAFHSVSLHDERGQMEDIENYIKSVVNTDPRNRRWKTEDKQLVIDVLTKNADGMYGINTQLWMTLAHTCNVGSDGYIARCTIFVAATPDVSGML